VYDFADSGTALLGALSAVPQNGIIIVKFGCDAVTVSVLAPGEIVTVGVRLPA
jgi:hypothetical protein